MDKQAEIELKCLVKINKDRDMDYLFNLIKQSYEKTL
jgi:hypothetical protein